MPSGREHSGRGRKLQFATRGRARRARAPPAMKKTSRRGAYAPARKRMMAIRRNPIVETFSDISNRWFAPGPDGAASLYPDTTVFRPLKIGNDIQFLDNSVSVVTPSHNEVFPVSVYNQKQNRKVYASSDIERASGQGITGDNIFAKNLYVKVELKLPSDTHLLKFQQCKMYMVHGWVTAPLNFNTKTNPAYNTVEPNAMMKQHIKEQIDQYFDSEQDTMLWIPKEAGATAIKIEGYKKIQWNKAESILPDPMYLGTLFGNAESAGALPTKKLNLQWKLNRKLYYVHGVNKQYAPGTDGERFEHPWYVNGQWLPFWMIYMPGGDQVQIAVNGQSVPDAAIQIRYNERLDYTDS